MFEIASRRWRFPLRDWPPCRRVRAAAFRRKFVAARAESHPCVTVLVLCMTLRVPGKWCQLAAQKMEQRDRLWEHAGRL
jgi:hypothetical protein